MTATKLTSQSIETEPCEFREEISYEHDCHDKNSLKQRWIILFLACVVMLGLYYLISLPASIHQQLKETMPQDDFEAKYQSLFAMAHFPGIVLPLFIGVLVDKFGGRACLVVLSTICLAGQITTSLGIDAKSWPIALTGRFIYGLGFEALFTTNQAFLAAWFGKKELGLALGVSSAISYMGFLLSFVISPLAANAITTGFSFWIGTVVKSVSVVASALIFVLDRAAERSIQTHKPGVDTSRVVCLNEQIEIENSTSQTRTASQHSALAFNEGGNDCKRIRLSDFSISFWFLCCSALLVYAVAQGFVNVASGLMLERNLFVEPPEDCVLQDPSQCSSGYLVPISGNPSIDQQSITCPKQTLHISYAPPWPTSLDVTKGAESSWDKSSYVLDPLLKSDIDCNDEFFAEACTYSYCNKQDKATEKAGFLMTIPYLVTIATTFAFGHYGVDKCGQRAEMICFAPLLLIISHGLLAFQRKSLVPPLIIHGLGYSISVSALWPSVPLTVKSSVVGTAFGLLTCVQNLGLALIPLIIASVYNSSGHRYLPGVEILFVGLSGVAFLVGIGLIYCEKKYEGKLRTRILQIIDAEVEDRELVLQVSSTRHAKL